MYGQCDSRNGMEKILILFAHPALERSRINKVLIRGVQDLPGVTFHDLYELYPDFYINVQREQELLLQHECIIWHHPLYWYSVPPLLKQWIDLVLEHDWAYGTNGIYLRGKKIFNVVTSGGGLQSYCDNGSNRYSIQEFLRPLEQTACLCSMTYLPPFVIHGTHRMTPTDAEHARSDYHQLLQCLIEEPYAPATFRGMELMNEYIACSYRGKG